MRLRVALCLLVLAGCDSLITAPPPPPTPVDLCEGLEPMSAVVVPDTIRVNGAATVSASGGSGRYTFTLQNAVDAGVFGSLSGPRYVAGLALGTDTIVAADDCGNFALV